MTLPSLLTIKNPLWNRNNKLFSIVTRSHFIVLGFIWFFQPSKIWFSKEWPGSCINWWKTSFLANTDYYKEIQIFYGWIGINWKIWLKNGLLSKIGEGDCLFYIEGFEFDGLQPKDYKSLFKIYKIMSTDPEKKNKKFRNMTSWWKGESWTFCSRLDFLI